MADIVKLRGSPHDLTQELLPWYIKGTLPAEKMAEIDAHLADCSACRRDLEAERRLASAIVELPLESERAWSVIEASLDRRPQSGSVPQRIALLGRRVPVAWVLASSLAAASAATILVMALPYRQPANQTYVALGSPPTSRAGNAVVMFTPGATEQELRTLLRGAGARLVNGPTASGAYVVEIAPNSLETALAGLNKSPSIALAQPIDIGKSP